MKTQTKTNWIAIGMMMGLGAITNAHAQGDKTGGGGDVLKCLENGKHVMYLLDSYEAKKRNYTLNLGGANLNREQKLSFAAVNYASLDPVRATVMLTEAKKMLQDIEDLENKRPARNGLVAFDGPLKDIDDAGEAVLYLGANEAPTAIQCSKAQLVRQEQPVSITDAFYTIDPTLWKTIDADQQVATILHEVIYKEFRENNMYLSKAARYLNGKVISNEIQNFSQKNYIQFLLENGLKTYSIDSINVLAVKNPLENLEYDTSENLTRANGVFKMTYGTLSWNIKNPEFKDGTLTKGTENERNSGFKITGNILSRDGGNEYRSGVASINPNGTLKLALPHQYKPGVVTIEVDSNLQIISRAETTQATIPDSTRNLLDQLYACVKPIAKKKNPDLVKSFLQKGRDAVNAKDESTLQLLVNECIDSGTTTLLRDFSPAVYTIENLLSRKIKEKLTCSGFNISATAAIMAGTNTGITANLNCTFPDGSRKTYAGLHLGLTMAAVGAGVKAGKVTYTDITFGKNRKVGSIFDPIFGEVYLGIKTPKLDDMIGTDYEGGDKKQYGIGLFGSAVSLQGGLIFAIGRKKADDYTALINQLIAGLVEEVK